MPTSTTSVKVVKKGWVVFYCHFDFKNITTCTLCGDKCGSRSSRSMTFGFNCRFEVAVEMAAGFQSGRRRAGHRLENTIWNFRWISSISFKIRSCYGYRYFWNANILSRHWTYVLRLLHLLFLYAPYDTFRICYDISRDVIIRVCLKIRIESKWIRNYFDFFVYPTVYNNCKDSLLPMWWYTVSDFVALK